VSVSEANVLERCFIELVVARSRGGGGKKKMPRVSISALRTHSLEPAAAYSPKHTLCIQEEAGRCLANRGRLEISGLRCGGPCTCFSVLWSDLLKTFLTPSFFFSFALHFPWKMEALKSHLLPLAEQKLITTFFSGKGFLRGLGTSFSFVYVHFFLRAIIFTVLLLLLYTTVKKIYILL